MGSVKAKIKLTNYGDLYAFKNSLIDEQKIRTDEITALVDTGATMLVIGEDVAERLGIEKEVFIKYADDSMHRHYKGKGILIEIDDRDCVTDCVILERGIEPLLGQIPLEEMDLIVDCANKRLIPNPESPDGKVVISVKSNFFLEFFPVMSY